MKKTTSILGALAVAAALTAGFTACTSDDNIIGNEPITEQPGAVKTYQVSIPATMPDDAQTRAVSFDGTTSTSTFAETEKVYVYNVTKDEMMGGYLQPSNITTDGKSCNLTGTLSGGTIEAGDELKLMYNLNYAIPDEHNYIHSHYFYYNNQNGTQSGVVDGALATVNVSSYTGGTLTTTAAASFQPVQSVFRFQFVDENNNPISVKTLLIKSTYGDISVGYWPLRPEGNRYGTNSMTVTPSSPTSDYLYVAICINEDMTPSALEFTVKDNDDNEYKGTKAAPSGGFKNGKYYYNTSAITLTKQAALVKPTITWTSVMGGNAVSPDVYNRYQIYGPWNGSSFSPSEITISGTSSGYFFQMEWGTTIHLNGLTATYDEEYQFIYSSGDLNLDISGANSITCKNYLQAIGVDGTLKLSGNGTLTVTANYADRYGFHATSNYNDNNNSDVSLLAATAKTTVTRSARTDNGDGTYTWTYTVTTTN